MHAQQPLTRLTRIHCVININVPTRTQCTSIWCVRPMANTICPSGRRPRWNYGWSWKIPQGRSYLTNSQIRFSRSYWSTQQCHDRLLSWYCPSVCPSVCSSVCPSVCLSVTLCIMALRVSVGGWKLCSYSWALSIHFFRHFCCMMYRLVTTHSDRLTRWQCRQQTSGNKSRLQFETVNA